MSTVSYDTFLSEVVPYVRDCPEFVAINAIRNACIEFCEKTLYLRQQVEDITVVSGQAVYDIGLSSIHTSVACVVSATLGRYPLVPRQEQDLVELYGGDWRTLSGAVQHITQDELDTVRLVLVPDRVYTDPLSLIAALRPMRTSTSIDRRIFESWAEVIGFGARARLHNTPGQPYNDEAAGAKFRVWFESGCSKATIAANKGLGRATLVVRPQRFY